MENARSENGRLHPTSLQINPPTLEESSIVERVARVVSSVRGTKPDYTRLAAELEPAIPFDVFGVVLLRHDRAAVRVTVCERQADIWISHCHQHPLEDSKMEQVLNEPVTIVENYPDGLDGPPAASGDALSRYPQLHAVFIAPLSVGDRVLGTLELGSTVLNTYDDKTLQRLIGAVVRVLAAAIESVQVGGSVEIQNRQRQVLKDVSTALTSKMDLPSILNQIVVGIANALNVASAIVTLDQRNNRLHLEAQSGLDPLTLRWLIGKPSVLSEQAIIGYTLRRRQPCVSQDISTDERFPISQQFTSELSIRSIFSYPLVTGTTVYGALLLCSPEPGGFTPLKADILSLFASQATIAIHNAMLIESAHQRSRFQKAIEQLEQTRSLELDEHDLLERVRQESEQTFGISFSCLLQFLSDHLLTRNERDLHAMLHTTQQSEDGATLISIDEPSHVRDHPPTIEERFNSLATNAQGALQQEEGLALLTQTAEAALARANMLSELSRLLMQIQQSTGDRTDAWFVIDLNGICISMNSAAEVFCDMPIGTGIGTENTIEGVFAAIVPKIRNGNEVLSYLRLFSHEGHAYRQNIRCMLATEDIHKKIPQDISSLVPYTVERQGKADYVPTDHHYQFTRYPLHNQLGALIANVLRVHDVTEQVRDEKNKSTLLSSVSHDLRTPLTTIKAAVTGLLQADVIWDEQTRREILEDIDTETDHLGVLVNALVEMSRIEMGALTLEKEWCDVVEVVHGALGRLGRVLIGREVNIKQEIARQSRLPLLYADHVQLERVFYNLIENAVRNSPEPSKILIILDVVDEPEMKMLRTRVINGGKGVPVEEHERIFKTFHGGVVHGSGLGLAICRGIVEAHQGRIMLEDAPNGKSGSCFTFLLPVHSYDAPSSTGFSSATGHVY